MQGPAPARPKKATPKSSIDPKDVENDFLKRELNIVKVHLIEKEAEVKDLSRKNKVLAEMVKILENKNQNDMADRNNPKAHMNVPTSCCSNTGGFTSRPSADVIQPDMVNKLLNFLVDLNLKLCNDTAKSHSNNSNTSEPTVTPSPSQDSGQTHQDAVLPDHVLESLQPKPQVVADHRSFDDSALTMDEFAPELSQESFSQVLETAQSLDSSANHLNSKTQTNQ